MTGVARRVRLLASLAVLVLVAALLNFATAPAATAALAAPTNPVPADAGELTNIPKLSWGAVADAASYKVQIATDTAFTNLRFEAQVIAPSAAPKVDLVPGTYYWRVQPLDSAGVGAVGPTWSFTRTTRAGPREIAPADGAVVDFPETAPILSWEPLPSVTGYEVQWSTANTFPVGSSTTSKFVNSTAYTLTSLQSQNRPLYWHVRGVYKTATSKTSSTTSKTDWSDAEGTRSFRTDWEVSEQTNSTPVLLTPSDDAAIDAAVSHPRFTWTPIAGAAKYRFQISVAANFGSFRINTDLVDPEYVGRGTLPAGAYYWRVAALDDNGSLGPWSESRQFFRGWVDNGELARPVVTASDEDSGTPGIQVSRDRFLVTWAPIRGASHYEVQIADHPEFSNLASQRLITCKTPHTSLTPVVNGAYRNSAALSACNFYRGTGTTLDIANLSTVYVRVRAIDRTPAGAHPGGSPVSEVASPYSNIARYQGDTAPDPLTISLTDVPTGPAGSTAATLTSPQDQSVHTGTPVLAWDRLPGATHYLVAASTDPSFSTSELGDGNGSNDYIVTRSTRLVMLESMLDYNAGEAIYWYVLPCAVWQGPTDVDNVCLGDASATNDPDAYVRTFRKAMPAVDGLHVNGASGSPTVTISQVRLSWSELLDTEASVPPQEADVKESAGSRFYELQVSTDADFSDAGKTVYSSSTDATEVIPEVAWNLEEDYFWRVRAVDGGGNNGDWSPTGGFTYRSELAPTGLTSASSVPHPTLTWDALAGAAAYELEVYAGDDPSFPAVSKLLGVTTAYPSWSPPTAGSSSVPIGWSAGTYSWRVRSVNALGAPGPWTPAAAGPADGMATFKVEAAPFNLGSPAASATTPMSNLRFSWDPVGGAAEYIVQLSTTSDFGSVGSDYATTTSNTSWTPSPNGGVTFPAGSYYWRVQAISNASTGKVLATSARRGVNVTTTPGQVTGVKATVLNRGTVELTWTKRPTNEGGSPTTGYRLWSRAGGGAWVEVSPASPGTATARTLTGLADSTDYEFRVAALNSVGTGKFSSAAKASTPGVPGAPRSLQVTAIDRGFTAKWYAPSGTVLPVLRYRLQYRITGTATWSTVLLPGTSITKTGLLPGKRYDIRVAAQNAVGWSSDASYSSPLLTKAAPTAPRSVRVVPLVRGATVRWLAPASAGSSPVTGYTVYYRVKGVTNWSSRSTTALSYSVTGLLSKKTYQVYVTARNATSGSGAGTLPVVFTTK